MRHRPPNKTGYKQLLAEANAQIRTLTVAEGVALLGNNDGRRGCVISSSAVRRLPSTVHLALTVSALVAE
jgi:hypothetical protein